MQKKGNGLRTTWFSVMTQHMLCAFRGKIRLIIGHQFTVRNIKRKMRKPHKEIQKESKHEEADSRKADSRESDSREANGREADSRKQTNRQTGRKKADRREQTKRNNDASSDEASSECLQ